MVRLVELALPRLMLPPAVLKVNGEPDGITSVGVVPPFQLNAGPLDTVLLKVLPPVKVNVFALTVNGAETLILPRLKLATRALIVTL